MPIAVVPGDLDSDGHTDLLVQDACDPNWVSRGPTLTSGENASEVLPDPGARPYIDFYHLGASPFIIGGSIDSAYTMSRAGDGWMGPVWWDVPPGPRVRVMRRWVAWKRATDTDTSSQFVFQGRGELHVISESEGKLSVVGTLTQILEPPYVIPFEAYDHLSVIDPAVCADTALGIGLFSGDASATPRRLQLLRLGAGATYEVSEVDVGLDEVTTFSGGYFDDRFVFGVFGRRAGRQQFVLAEIVGCVRVDILAETSVVMEFRTPALPEDYEQESVPLTDGLSFLPFALGGALYFAHYDGFDARLVVVHASGDSWLLEERNYEVHDKRTDSSFGG